MVAMVQKEDNTLDDNKWIPSTHQSLQLSDWAGPHPPGLVPAVLWSWAPSLIPGVPGQVCAVSELPGRPLR